MVDTGDELKFCHCDRAEQSIGFSETHQPGVSNCQAESAACINDKKADEAMLVEEVSPKPPRWMGSDI